MVKFFQQKQSVAWWLFAAVWLAAGHLFVTWPVWKDPLVRLPGPTGDNTMMLWNLGWVKYALDNGSPGFWNTAAFYPDGFLFIYGSHTWLDGVLYWLTSWLLPTGYEGAILWANLNLLGSTVATGLLVMCALRAWGVTTWPLLLLVATGVAFSWFRMFALMGHYNFLTTHWMLIAVCLASWARRAYAAHDLRRWKWLAAGAGLALGIASLNDQTMAIYAGVIGGLVLLSLPVGDLKRGWRDIAVGAVCFYGIAILPALIHLAPIVLAAGQGRLDYYHVDKTLPRLVDATSFVVPNDLHLLGRHLGGLRERAGLGWSEGTYLGVVPLVMLLAGTAGAIGYLLKRSPALKVCFFAAAAAWGFIVLGLGDRLMIGREQYFLLPGRVLKEIPLLNNMRVPQRWVWPAHLAIALSGASAMYAVLVHWWNGRESGRTGKRHWVVSSALLGLAVLPILEGRSYPIAEPVDYTSPFVRPPGLVEGVESRYVSGGVLTMPIEATFAHTDILQFLWGYDIPATVVYSARMPVDVHKLPWKWAGWTPEAGEWLKEKDVTMVVFPFHAGRVEEFADWVRQAKQAVPGLVVLNQNGEEI